VICLRSVDDLCKLGTAAAAAAVVVATAAASVAIYIAAKDNVHQKRLWLGFNGDGSCPYCCCHCCCCCCCCCLKLCLLLHWLQRLLAQAN
jgi:hypothetical protein